MEALSQTSTVYKQIVTYCEAVRYILKLQIGWRLRTHFLKMKSDDVKILISYCNYANANK